MNTHTPAAEEARREAWRSAVGSSALNLAVGSVAVVAFVASSRLPLWPVVQFAAVGAVLLGLLLAFKKVPRWMCFLALSLNYGSALLASLAGADAQARLGEVSQLFNSIAVSLFVVAILSPSVLFGAVWIALFAAAPVIETQLWPAEIVRMLPTAEPWMTVAYGVAALGLLVYRRRHLFLQHELAAARAERLALEQLARMALSVRDLANTPMQTLTAGVALLRAHDVPQAVVLDSMERALEKLSTLRRALAGFEQHIVWQSQDASFDALARIEEMATTPAKGPLRG